MSNPNRLLVIAAVLAVSLAGCAKKQVEEHRDIHPIAEAYYKAHPEFFHFKTLADLPKDLVWQDGHNVPTFADPAAKRGGTFHGCIPDFPRTTRIVGPDSNGGIRPFILDDTQLWLIQKQPNTGQYYPALARQWAFDPDGRTIYFRLDPDARFSDGKPVTVDSFLFDFYFFRSPYLHDPWYNNWYSKYYTQITKYDDLTFSLSWYVAKPDLADKLGNLSPLDEDFYNNFGPDYVQRYQWLVEPTTGPYTVLPENIKKGTSVDITHVPNWWAENKPFFRHRYNIDRFHLIVIRDPDKAMEAFKRGDIDDLDLTRPQNWHDKLPDRDPLVQHGAIAKVTFYNEVPRVNMGFWLNRSDPLLANRDIRIGINYACNFDLVIKQYYRGDYVRMQTSADGYPDVPLTGIHPRPFSVDDALAAFARAGFTKRGPDGVLVGDHGRRLSFTLTSPYEQSRDPLTILRQEALKAGLELKLEILDPETAYKKMTEKHHQIGFAGYVVNNPPEMYPRFWEFFDSSNANKPVTSNLTDTADPVMDHLIDQYDKARTLDEIRRLAVEIERRIRDDAAFIPSYEADYYRTGYWRWLCFPPTFATRQSIEAPGLDGYDFGLCWIDDSMRPAVLAAAHGGKPLPVEIKVYDQWKEK